MGISRGITKSKERSSFASRPAHNHAGGCMRKVTGKSALPCHLLCSAWVFAVLCIAWRML